jgi:hypothetical protein
MRNATPSIDQSDNVINEICDIRAEHINKPRVKYEVHLTVTLRVVHRLSEVLGQTSGVI